MFNSNTTESQTEKPLAWLLKGPFFFFSFSPLFFPLSTARLCAFAPKGEHVKEARLLLSLFPFLGGRDRTTGARGCEGIGARVFFLLSPWGRGLPPPHPIAPADPRISISRRLFWIGVIKFPPPLATTESQIEDAWCGDFPPSSPSAAVVMTVSVAVNWTRPQWSPDFSVTFFSPPSGTSSGRRLCR